MAVVTADNSKRMPVESKTGGQGCLIFLQNNELNKLCVEDKHLFCINSPYIESAVSVGNPGEDWIRREPAAREGRFVRGYFRCRSFLLHRFLCRSAYGSLPLMRHAGRAAIRGKAPLIDCTGMKYLAAGRDYGENYI